MRFKDYFKFVLYLVVFIGFSTARAGAFEDYFMAIENDNSRIVRGLLERGFDPNTKDAQGQVGLFLAFRHDAYDTADALWAHPALQVDVVNQAGETPMMMAALRGRRDWVQRLLDRGARLQSDGWSAVHYAATGPDSSVVQLLLDKGARVDARSPNGSTPLMMAARYGTEASVALLLARGADLRLRNQQGLDAADFARLEGRDALADELVAKRPAR
jgi:ankyrin repeat protein